MLALEEFLKFLGEPDVGVLIKLAEEGDSGSTNADYFISESILWMTRYSGAPFIPASFDILF
jgi:hypothetical protein